MEERENLERALGERITEGDALQEECARLQRLVDRQQRLMASQEEKLQIFQRQIRELSHNGMEERREKHRLEEELQAYQRQVRKLVNSLKEKQRELREKESITTEQALVERQRQEREMLVDLFFDDTTEEFQLLKLYNFHIRYQVGDLPDLLQLDQRKVLDLPLYIDEKIHTSVERFFMEVICHLPKLRAITGNYHYPSLVYLCCRKYRLSDEVLSEYCKGPGPMDLTVTAERRGFFRRHEISFFAYLTFMLNERTSVNLLNVSHNGVSSLAFCKDAPPNVDEVVVEGCTKISDFTPLLTMNGLKKVTYDNTTDANEAFRDIKVNLEEKGIELENRDEVGRADYREMCHRPKAEVCLS
ncbi:hypothetical protein ADEAN_000671700 [Angomonas deanei]|uniref:Leucine Rich repeat n=1 Tax=Angomonas deanei TaxID=59799 RepID=A0A7G2CIM0_9TRYP|nr:hypothetical protein ADEAN_000671700 [Angomonas deanei]